MMHVRTEKKKFKNIFEFNQHIKFKKEKQEFVNNVIKNVNNGVILNYVAFGLRINYSKADMAEINISRNKSLNQARISNQHLNLEGKAIVGPKLSGEYRTKENNPLQFE